MNHALDISMTDARPRPRHVLLVAVLTGGVAFGSGAAVWAQAVQNPGSITGVSTPEWIPPRPTSIVGQMQGTGLGPGIDDYGHLKYPVSGTAPISAVYAEALHGTNVGLGIGVALMDEQWIRYVGSGTYEMVLGSAAGTGKSIRLATCVDTNPPAQPAGTYGSFFCHGGGWYVTRNGDCELVAWGHGQVLVFEEQQHPTDRFDGRLGYEGWNATFFLTESLDVQTGVTTSYKWHPTLHRLDEISDDTGLLADLDWVGEGTDIRLDTVKDRYQNEWKFNLERQYLRTLTTPMGEVKFGYDRFGLLERTYTTRVGTGYPVGTQIWERWGPFDTTDPTNWVVTHMECRRTVDGYTTVVPNGPSCPAGHTRRNTESTLWPMIRRYLPPVGSGIIYTYGNHNWNFATPSMYRTTVAVTDTVSKAWEIRIPFYAFEKSSGERGVLQVTRDIEEGSTEMEGRLVDADGHDVAWFASRDERAERPGISRTDDRFRTSFSTTVQAGGPTETVQIVWVSANEYEVRDTTSPSYWRIQVDAHGNPVLQQLRTATVVRLSIATTWTNGLPTSTTITEGTNTTTETITPSATHPWLPGEITNVTGQTTFTYNSDGSVATESGPASQVVYGYNPRGGLSSTTVKDLSQETNNDLVTQVTDWHPGAGTGTPFAMPKTVTYPGGSVTIDQNAAGFPSAASLLSGTFAASETLTLDSAGRPTQSNRQTGAATELVLITQNVALMAAPLVHIGSSPNLPTVNSDAQACGQKHGELAIRKQELSFAFCLDNHTAITCTRKIADSGQVYFHASKVVSEGELCEQYAPPQPDTLTCPNGQPDDGSPRVRWVDICTEAEKSPVFVVEDCEDGTCQELTNATVTLNGDGTYTASAPGYVSATGTLATGPVSAPPSCYVENRITLEPADPTHGTLLQFIVSGCDCPLDGANITVETPNDTYTAVTVEGLADIEVPASELADPNAEWTLTVTAPAGYTHHVDGEYIPGAWTRTEPVILTTQNYYHVNFASHPDHYCIGGVSPKLGPIPTEVVVEGNDNHWVIPPTTLTRPPYPVTYQHVAEWRIGENYSDGYATAAYHQYCDGAVAEERFFFDLRTLIDPVHLNYGAVSGSAIWYLGSVSTGWQGTTLPLSVWAGFLGGSGIPPYWGSMEASGGN